MSGRTIAIGDIHGCAEALRALLAAVDPQPQDTVITLGDYVDRGPDSRGVIEQMLALRERCRLMPLFGNHEIMLLDAMGSALSYGMWIHCGGQATIDSYGGSLDNVPASHHEFLHSCLPYFETQTHLFLHAGYDPELPLDDQPQDALLWRHILTDVPPPHCSGKIAVVGHTPQTNGQVRSAGHVILLDTYCFGGGWLSALEIETGCVWQADRQGRLRPIPDEND
jgi:serine/threonine protein phosphatase 1